MERYFNYPHTPPLCGTHADISLLLLLLLLLIIINYYYSTCCGWGGLRVLMTPRAMLAEAKAPGRVTHARQVKG
jgi:hypothetical protein